MSPRFPWLLLMVAALLIPGCSSSAPPDGTTGAGSTEGSDTPTSSGADDAEALAGDWVLVAMGDETDFARPITMTVDLAEAKISGHSACNTYFSPWMAADGKVEIGLAGSTMMACAEPAMGQEAAYFGALEAASGYRLNGDEMELTDDDGTVVLRFNRPAPD